MEKTNNDLPVFDLVITEGVEGMTANSFVKNPAHGQPFVAFTAEDKPEQVFAMEAEKGWVTGPLIVPDLLIYRKATRTLPEHYVKFTREQIEQIVIGYAKKGYFNRVTYEHAIPMEGATLIEHWIAGEQDKSHALGLKPKAGTLMGTYFVENPQLKEAIKRGDVTSFSIEGFFDHVEVLMSAEGEALEVKTEKDRALQAHFQDNTLDGDAWQKRLDEILSDKSTEGGI